jgi:transmembrane sensor
MTAFEAADNQRLDPAVVDQAMQWMVALQSGTCSAGQYQACERWRGEHPQHELAWQRLAGLNRDIAGSAQIPGARGLLQARAVTSRRTLLKGFACLGVAAATGYSVQQRVLLPHLFSDYHTATGERRDVLLGDGMKVQLDTRTALDAQATPGILRLTLSGGRLLLDVGSHVVQVLTSDGSISPTAGARLIISQHIPGIVASQVQMLVGTATVQLRQGREVELGTGQQLAFDHLRAEPIGQVPATATAWASGLLIAERMPLQQVLAQLDRYRPGVLRCDPAVAALQVSGSFSLDRPQASLALLAKILPVRVQQVFGYWATVVPEQA